MCAGSDTGNGKLPENEARPAVFKSGFNAPINYAGRNASWATLQGCVA